MPNVWITSRASAQKISNYIPSSLWCPSGNVNLVQNEAQIKIIDTQGSIELVSRIEKTEIKEFKIAVIIYRALQSEDNPIDNQRN